jgi:hypothetical protein
MPLHALWPLAIRHDAFFALHVQRRIFEHGARGCFIGREVTQHIADAARCADMHRAVTLACEEAGHFLDRNVPKRRFGRLNLTHGICEQSAAAPPAFILALFRRHAAGGADHHRRTRLYRTQHQNRLLRPR